MIDVINRLGGITIENNNPHDIIPESVRKSIENLPKIATPISGLEASLKHIDGVLSIPKIELSMPTLYPVRELTENSATKAVQAHIDIANITNAINTGVTNCTLGISICQFGFPDIDVVSKQSLNTLIELRSGFDSLLKSSTVQGINSVRSYLIDWLQTVYLPPLTNVLKDIREIGFDYDYNIVNEVFLKALFDAKWFPYAGWIVDIRIMNKIIGILNTSRVSKNRVKRIDRLIFSYYTKKEIDDFKHRWRNKKLPSYMTRILIQSVNAYLRREYALTVSALSTLWEGIIQEKVNDDSYRVSRKTRENLTKLIEKNQFNKIFSSFCEEFIFYDCRKTEEVKPEVPGRHGIAHGWYNTYPNRKVALNAILFTDFLLELKPLDRMEKNQDGQENNRQA